MTRWYRRNDDMELKSSEHMREVINRFLAELTCQGDLKVKLAEYDEEALLILNHELLKITNAGEAVIKSNHQDIRNWEYM